MTLVQGTDGVELVFTVKNESGQIVNLNGTEVKFMCRKTDVSFQKPCTILNAMQGICSVVLSETDLDIGDCIYFYQINVKFSDIKEYRSSKESFFVEARL